MQSNFNNLQPAQRIYLQKLQNRLNEINKQLINPNDLTEKELRSILTPVSPSAAIIAENLINEFGLNNRKLSSLNSNYNSFKQFNDDLNKKSSQNGQKNALEQLLDKDPKNKPLSIEMTSAELVEYCTDLGLDGEINMNLLSNEELKQEEDASNAFSDLQLVEPICTPYSPLPPSNLQPPTPSVYIDNKKDAHSPNLQQFCFANPIAVVRGLTNVLKLDLGLFSTKTLVETNPDHPIEIRTQIAQPSDENWHPQKAKMVWFCESHRSYSTIAKYAKYQASTFQESLREEQEKNSNNNKDQVNINAINNNSSSNLMNGSQDFTNGVNTAESSNLNATQNLEQINNGNSNNSSALTKDSDSDSNCSSIFKKKVNRKVGNNKDQINNSNNNSNGKPTVPPHLQHFKTIKFGTNVDLSGIYFLLFNFLIFF